MQAMENIPGVQAMDIGSAFQTDDSRNGIQPDCCIGKTESNRKDNMGSRSRLELDAFNIGAVNVLKGPPHCSMAVMQWE